MVTAAADDDKRRWISQAEAKARIGIRGDRAFKKLVAGGSLSVRVLPGLAWPRYDAEEIAKLSRESVIPARRPVTA